MGQLGYTVNEAQTAASRAVAQPQTLDPSLSTDFGSLSQSDRAAVEQYQSARPEQGAPPGLPQHSRPLTQEEIELLRPREEREPILPRIFGQIGRDVRRSLTQEPSTPAQPSPFYSSPTPSPGASAGQQIAQSQQATPPAPQNQQPTTGFNPAMAGPRPGIDDPNAMTPATAPAVQRAIEVAKSRSAPQMASTQTAPETAAPQSDFIHSLIRGRFGDAAKGNPMDDRLTALQEARDKSGEARASGGSVGGKDAALHKALEIIHHLIRTR